MLLVTVVVGDWVMTAGMAVVFGVVTAIVVAGFGVVVIS